MKSILVTLSILLLGLTASLAQTPAGTGVEVLYFHGKQRCATCKAIETHARTVVDEEFAAQVKEGKVRFRAIDISTPEGEQLADRYRVTRSALFINGWKEGKESRNDLTLFAFRHARNDTGQFKKEIKEKIAQLLQ